MKKEVTLEGIQDRKLHWFEHNGKYGYINSEGEIVIPCIWDEAFDFHDGLAAVVDEDKKQGYINMQGDLVIPCEWIPSINPNFKNGVVQVDKIIGKDHLGDVYGHFWLDKTGKEIPEPEYRPEFSDGLTPVIAPSTGELQSMGYEDEEGHLVIPYHWWFAEPFSDGLAAVAVEGDLDIERWGYIDKLGKEVVPCQFHDAKDFSESLAPVNEGSYNNPRWGYIDKTGTFVSDQRWSLAFPFQEGLASIKDYNRKWGYINTRLDVVISCQFDAVEDFYNGTAWVEIDGTWKVIDKQGNFCQL